MISWKRSVCSFLPVMLAMLAAVCLEVRAQELQLASAPPFAGTFYLAQRSDLPPYPFDPYLGQLLVYELGPGIYMIDDSAVDYTASLNQNGGGSMLMSEDFIAPPPPCDPCSTNGGGGGVSYTPPTYGSSDLWLQIINATNNQASFVIHTPETNGLYDLFTTTNMNTWTSGLNQTNWLWLLRTQAGETNLIVTNIWPREGWFQLGTMWDSDGDGITDAWESLTGHTDPYNPNDTDGDGIPDGFDPTPGTPAGIPTLIGRSISKCPITY